MPTRKQKELQTVEEFEGTLGEEISVSTEFDLPLSVLVAVMDWTPESLRRALDALRTADLVARTAEDEIVIALPNTVSENALVVERRLRAAIPEAAVGVTTHRTGDTVPDLVSRARAAARGD